MYMRNANFAEWKPGDKCLCGEVLYAYMDIDGGCQGHGEGEYCYCPSLDVTFSVRCLKGYGKNKHTDSFVPAGLTDRYGVERWINRGGPE